MCIHTNSEVPRPTTNCRVSLKQAWKLEISLLTQDRSLHLAPHDELTFLMHLAPIFLPKKSRCAQLSSHFVTYKKGFSCDLTFLCWFMLPYWFFFEALVHFQSAYPIAFRSLFLSYAFIDPAIGLSETSPNRTDMSFCSACACIVRISTYIYI